MMLLRRSFKKQIAMDISFHGRVVDHTAYFGSTLAPMQRDTLPAALRSSNVSDAGRTVMLDDEPFLTQVVILNQRHSNVSVVLQKSLDAATQSYRRLRDRLILLATISLIAAVGMGIWICTKCNPAS